MHIRGSIVGVGAALCGAALLVAGCGQGTEHKKASSASSSAPAAPADSGTPAASLPTTPPKPQVLGSGGPAAKTAGGPDTRGLNVQINSATRDSGGVVTLTWTLANENGKTFDPYGSLSDVTSKYFGQSVSQVNLIDQSQKLRFYPLIDNQNGCSCSSGSGSVNKGDKITLYDQYKVPQNTKTVDIQIKGFQPVKNVPIS